MKKMDKSSFFRRAFEKSPRFWMSIALLFSDLFAFVTSVGLTFLVWRLISDKSGILIQYMRIFPFSFIFFVSLYLLRGLYPGIAVNRIVELKRLVVTTTFGYLVIVAFVSVFEATNPRDTIFFTILWGFSLGLVPFSRWVFRGILIYVKMWGEPVIVFGQGKECEMILDHLNRYKKLGLRPVAVVNGQKTTQGEYNIPTILWSSWFQDRNHADQYPNVRTAILIYPEVSASIFNTLVDNQLGGFSRLIFVSGWEHLRSSWVQPVDLVGILGLEIRKNLLNKREQLLKRILDITIVLVVSIVMFPFLLLLFGLVYWDSGGKPLYNQIRFGYQGKRFKLYKFRTMVLDADKILTAYLETHPEMQVEWEFAHKLKNDPRTTWFGQILRKLSLDEIPQIWNVLKGEMSIVGPRPIVDTEIPKYQDTFTLYQQVKPGITGLWQVLGRNNTSYSERIRLDEYYVRNWSIWMDIYIIIRTAWVVIRRRGAY
jgi:Undecaprenyl-phosphate galactose phosphotransferase WbaP